MLQGANTTISIAHRLSTIQRSDLIICIGTDGKVAQTGTYRDLAADKDGAFAKLMEWQMSGGSTSGTAAPGKGKEVDPELTEEERMKLRLEEHDRVQEFEEQVEEQGEEASGEKENAVVRATEGEKKQ
jgi:putative ABC transport system ATP-binding protein